ncbi:MAG: glycosyltransferase family 39 protein [Anaerolineae bacterium]|nr:MAG: glycosyltransferase family 39 protein [Anaerolineae bacterium]
MKRWLELLRPYVQDGAEIMLLLFLAVAAVLYGLHVFLAVLHRYPLDYGEAPLVDQAMRLASGQNIYRADLSSPPYTVSNYPPLYPLALAPLVKLFGPSLVAGRLVSILCALASAFFLAQIVYVPSQDRTASLTTGLIFLAFPYVVGWSKLARVDLLALAFSTAGLYAAVRWPATRRGLVVSGLLLVAAIYTRQSYALAAPLAAFVWLWAHDRRYAIALAALVGGLSLLFFLALNIVTGGGFFFNLVTANVNEFRLDQLERWLRDVGHAIPILLVLGGVFLFFAFRRVKSWSLVVPYLIGALLSALTIGKIGSNVNYFLEFSAALSLVAGAFLVWSRERPWLRSAALILLALQVGLLMQATLRGPVESLKWRIKQPERYFTDLEWIVESADGPVLADEFMGILTLQDKLLYIQPFEVTQLANAGVWDQTPLLESIRRREFPAIFIHHFMSYPVYQERWTSEMLSATMENYVPTDFLADTIVYRPRDAGTTRPVELDACPDAPWRLATRGELGVWWLSRHLIFMGPGYENTVPVYAVADGLLTRRPDWRDAVAIQHDDPLRVGEKVWTYYSGMASGRSDESFVAPGFPPDSEGIPVKRGQLLGYQGQYSAQLDMPFWVHLHFAVLPPAADGSLPAGLVGSVAEEEPTPDRAEDARPLDPSPYLGTVGSNVMGYLEWMPLQCQTDAP